MDACFPHLKGLCKPPAEALLMMMARFPKHCTRCPHMRSHPLCLHRMRSHLLCLHHMRLHPLCLHRMRSHPLCLHHMRLHPLCLHRMRLHPPLSACCHVHRCLTHTGAKRSMRSCLEVPPLLPGGAHAAWGGPSGQPPEGPPRWALEMDLLPSCLRFLPSTPYLLLSILR